MEPSQEDMLRAVEMGQQLRTQGQFGELERLAIEVFECGELEFEDLDAELQQLVDNQVAASLIHLAVDERMTRTRIMDDELLSKAKVMFNQIIGQSTGQLRQ